jgi:RNA polymerase sigma-B factor
VQHGSQQASPSSVPDLAGLHRRYFDQRDPADRARLLDRYQGLARALAIRSARPSDDLDDLVQVALVGVLSALERFDPDRNVEFTTFAWATVQGELKRHHRDRGWSIHVPRRLQEAYLRTAAAVEDLHQELGRQPSIGEIAARTGDEVELVIEALEVQSARRPGSLDARRSDDTGPAWEPGEIDGSFVQVEERSLLSSLLPRLAPREREVLQLRFLEEWTQAQIAERIGCSQMHVSRLLTRALGRLREWVEIENRAVVRRPRPGVVQADPVGVA